MIKIEVFRDGVLTNGATFETQELADAWLAKHNFSGEIVITDITAKLEQEKINAEAQAFLDATDFKIIRHLDQQNLGISTKLTAEEFQELLHQRQMAREAIIKE